jgi:hypothetical protein
MNDPIVDEVRRVRDEHVARFDYDLNAIFRDIKEREKKSGLKFVAGVARKSMPNEALIKYSGGRQEQTAVHRTGAFHGAFSDDGRSRKDSK